MKPVWQGAGFLGIVASFILLVGCGGNSAPSGVVSPDEGISEAVDFGQATLSPAQASGWSVETVEGGPSYIGWQTSIGAGTGGFPTPVRISYYNQITRDLRLASGSVGGPWTLTTLDAPFDVGKYNSLVWNGISPPQISYYKASANLKAYQGTPVVVDAQIDTGAYSDISYGPEENLYISYTATYFITNLNKRSQVRHAFFDGTWSTEVVDDGPATAGSFAFTSNTISAPASPVLTHISYRGQNGRLKHAWGIHGLWWLTEEVLAGNPSTANVGQTSILLTSDGILHIFYTKAGAGAGLYHAWQNWTGWQVELVATGFGIMTPSAATEDSNGKIHIAAYKSNTQDLVHFTSGPWTAETVDSAGDVGKFAAIVRDSQDCLHISYINDTTDDVKYATNCEAPPPNNPPQITSISATPGSINEGGTVTLTVVATDPNNDPLTYTWSQDAPGSPVGLFESPASATTPWRAPPIPSGPVAFTLRATVCDPSNACDTATVNVTVEDIFNGPAYGSTGTPAGQNCTTGPSGLPEGIEILPEQVLPLLTPDDSLYQAMKGNPPAPDIPPLPSGEEEGFFIPSAAPSLSTDFQGLTYMGLRPPDPHIAAGPSHIIAIVNSKFGIFNKTGTELFEATGFSWFSPVNSLTFIFDPKVNYDAYNQRWLLLFHATNFSAGQSRWLLAASQSANPLGCWWMWSLDNTLNGSTPSSPLNWADYSDMGFDGNYIYLSSNQFGFSPTSFHYTKVRVLKASEVYSGSILNWVDYWNHLQANGENAFTIRPAYSLGNPPPYEYLANAHWPGDTMFTLWGMKDPFSPTPAILRAGIPVGFYSVPPDASQPGTTCLVDTIDSRIMNVIWRNGSLWTVQNTAVNWGSGTVSALKYHHVNTDTLTLLDDIYFGADGIHYFDGAVMEDSSGNMATVFARSSSSIYPGAYYTVKPDGGSIDPAVGVLHIGENYTCGTRWGDYAGNWIDPSDNLTFWIFHEYILAGTPGWNTWNTWVGALTVP